MQYVEHNNQIGDHCPWSLRPAPESTEPGEDLCPARCPHSATDPDPGEAGEAAEADPMRLNTGASFAAQTGAADDQLWDYTRPCLTVAGVQVYAYLDTEGCLAVSVDLDTAQLHYGPNPGELGTPLRIRVGQDEVLPRGWPPGRGDCLCTYHTGPDSMTALVRCDPDCEVPPDEHPLAEALLRAAATDNGR